MRVLLSLVILSSCTSLFGQVTPNGERLKDLAPPDFAIGAASNGYGRSWLGPLDSYQTVAKNEFNAMTSTCYMAYNSWKSPNGDTSNVPPTADPDTSGLVDLTNWAVANKKRVHGHVLVYPAANLDLKWWRDLPNSQVESKLSTYVNKVATSTKGKMWVWDVVNEVIGDNGAAIHASASTIPPTGSGDVVDLNGIRRGVYNKDEIYQPYKEYSAMGPGYIKKAFDWAAAADDNALLIINEYGAEEMNLKSDRLLALCIELRNQGAKIDGVGFQMHLDFEDPVREIGPPDFQSIIDNFKRFAAAGFKIFITEMDVTSVATRDPANVSPDTAAQRTSYETVMQIALNQPACKGLFLWDYADDRSWLHPLTRDVLPLKDGEYTFPTPFWGGDVAGQYPISPKPAYYGLQQALQNHNGGLYRLTSEWQPATSFLNRGAINDTPDNIVGLDELDPVSANWWSMQWNLEKVSSGIYRIRCRWGENSGYLTRDGFYNGTNWIPEPTISLHGFQPNWDSQLWMFEPEGDGAYRLDNFWGPGNGFLTRDGFFNGTNWIPESTVSLHPYGASWSSQVWYFDRISE